MLMTKILGDCERLLINSGRELPHVLNPVSVVQEIDAVLDQDPIRSVRFTVIASPFATTALLEIARPEPSRFPCSGEVAEALWPRSLAVLAVSLMIRHASVARSRGTGWRRNYVGRDIVFGAPLPRFNRSQQLTAAADSARGCGRLPLHPPPQPDAEQAGA
jgi:hypothetical protein